MPDDIASVAPVESPVAEPEPATLADHESLFGAPDQTLEGDAKKANEEARAKVRHRARSQQASPEDAPRIQELTRKLRETEAERDALRAKPQTPPPVASSVPSPPGNPSGDAGVARQAAAPSGVNFDDIDEDTGFPRGWTPTRPEPTVEDIGEKYATYEAFTRAQARWVHDQFTAIRQAQQQVESQARQQAESQQAWHKAHQTYAERRDAFKAQHADFDALMDQHGERLHIPIAPYQAILASEHGPAWVYHLLQHHDDAADLALLFDGKPPTDAMIAHATRWLSSRATPPAEPAAPAPKPALTLAPPPPSPVKTGAARAEPDPDDLSIEAHEKQYLKRRR